MSEDLYASVHAVRGFRFLTLIDADARKLDDVLRPFGATAECWEDTKKFQHSLKGAKVIVAIPGDGSGRDAGEKIFRRCMRLSCSIIYAWLVDQLGSVEIPNLEIFDQKSGIVQQLSFDRPWEPKAASAEEGKPEDDAIDEGPTDQVGSVDPAAFYGVLGRLSQKTQPETEGNPLFVLAHLIALFGCTIGRKAHLMLSVKIYLNLFVGIVGPTGALERDRQAMPLWRYGGPLMNSSRMRTSAAG